MLLPHLADVLGSFLVLEKCTEVPFVIDAKCFTRLELYSEGKKKTKKPSHSFSVESHFN